MKKTILLSFILFGLFTSAFSQDSTSYKIRATYQGGGKGLASSFLEVPAPTGSNLNLDTSFTVECWVFIDSKDSAKEFNLIESYGTYSGLELFIDNGFIGAHLYDTGSSSVIRQASWGNNYKITFDEWNHIAVSFNSEKGYFNKFLNGQLLITKVASTSYVPIDFQNDAFRIGGDGGYGFAEADFQIDEIRIWKNLRTGAEISENYNKCLKGDEANLLAYYTFEGVTDLTDIQDQSGNGNVGELKNAPDMDRLVGGAYSCKNETNSINQKSAKQFLVYPNPTSSTITVKTDQPIEQIQVLNLAGQVLRTFTQTNNQINVTDLTPGVYLLQVEGQDDIGYSRFIKN